MDIEQLVNAVYAYTVPYRLVVAGIDIGMVVHQHIFRWYPSGIIDFTGFLKVPLAVIQETYNRLGLACNVRVGLNEFVGSVLFTYYVIGCTNPV